MKLHGRWKSDSAKDMYVKEQVQERLDVAKNRWNLEFISSN